MDEVGALFGEVLEDRAEVAGEEEPVDYGGHMFLFFMITLLAHLLG